MCRLNWGATLIWHNTLKSHKIIFIVWITLKAKTLFHTRVNLLCLVCRCIVCVLAAHCIFYVTKAGVGFCDGSIDEAVFSQVKPCVWENHTNIIYFYRMVSYLSASLFTQVSHCVCNMQMFVKWTHLWKLVWLRSDGFIKLTNRQPCHPAAQNRLSTEAKQDW